MARLDRYMLSQLMMLFGFFSLLLILVYWVNRAVRLFDQLIADGQTLGVFLTLSTLTLPTIIRIILPIATFAAAIYVTNRMTSESELVVVQATGYSSFRIARPIAYFGLIVTVLMALLLHYLVPVSTTELNKRQAEIAENATARLLREGQFLTPTDGVTFYIREVTNEGELRDIFLSDSRNPLETVTYTATSAFIVRTEAGPQLVMVDGMAQNFETDTRRLGTTSFDDLAYNLGTLVTLPDPSRRSARELVTTEMLAPSPAILAETRRTAAQLRAEAHERIARTFQPLVSALIGFATLLIGGFSRFGVWRQILVAIFLLILIKTIESGVTNVVTNDPGAWPLTYLPEVTGLIIALVLLGWSIRPAWLRGKRYQGAAA